MKPHPTPRDADVPLVSDAELVERMAHGDREALGALFDRHHQALNNFLIRAYGAREVEIEDLVQTTFLEAFRTAAKYRAAAAPRTWLFAIGSNVTKMHRRSTKRRERALASYAELPAVAPSAIDARIADRRALAVVESALAELPHDLRVAYVMCVIEDVPGDDAARALGVPRGTIWRRVHEARTVLRAAVERGGTR